MSNKAIYDCPILKGLTSIEYSDPFYERAPDGRGYLINEINFNCENLRNCGIATLNDQGEVLDAGLESCPACFAIRTNGHL
jgi:hypothetical protein